MLNLLAVLTMSIGFVLFHLVKSQPVKLEPIPIIVRSESEVNKPSHSKTQE